MVRITKVKKDTKEYYVLAHNIRKGRRVLRKEKYLGVQIPYNIQGIREEFERELFEEMYGSELEAIYQQYKKIQEQLSPVGIEKLNEDFGIRFTYDSNKMEGGSLTKNETKVLILHDQAPQRPLKDVLETKAHFELVKHLQSYEGEIGFNVILEWHYLLFKESQQTIAGTLRDQKVQISGSDLIPPSPVELQPALDDFFQWYEQEKHKYHPVELATLVHYRFVAIHPFMDGNGRISRLLMNFILQKNGYPPYNLANQERKSYYRALSKADSEEDPYILVRYLTKKYLKAQHKRLKY